MEMDWMGGGYRLVGVEKCDVIMWLSHSFK